MNLVFVYGTLKMGHPNHHVLQNSPYMGVDKVCGLLYDLGPFPGMVCNLTEDDFYVHGEVYEVSAQVLERLDRLEGVPNLYTRHKFRTLNNNDEVYVYLYEGPLHNAKLIEDGVWT